ncbi:hypothetical protein A4X13_0g4912 [Tilletia indica]|uniref:Uncharacterized protein n=1 Tax=Tilletia indica TaxID=43049 RepID=A0A177TJP4_9BASI|nr:hypothetical protein A4X13_0g4912 [Tilletia indica]
MSAHAAPAQHLPRMPTHPPPPAPPPKRVPSYTIQDGGSSPSSSSWNHQYSASPVRDRLNAPSSRRTSGRASADEGDDHFTDADSVYGDPNEPIPSPNLSSSRVASGSGPGQTLIQTAAAAVAAASSAGGMPARQSSYSSSSSSHSGSSPRQSVDSPTSPTFGAARPFSVSSSIWAGKGALHPSTAANRRRAGAPPMPPLPHAALVSAAEAVAVPSPSASTSAARTAAQKDSRSSQLNQSHSTPQSPYSLPSPLSDEFNSGPPRHSFESSSMYSYMDDDTRAGHGNSPREWRTTDSQGSPIPPMPPLPAAVEGRKGSMPTINAGNTSSSTLSAPSAAALNAFRNRGLRPPPIPSSNARRPLLSYAEAEAQEEEELSAVLREEDAVGGPAANKRLSAMGPKLKKNAPAPWELGADDDGDIGPGRPSGTGSAGTSGGGGGGSFNPFSKRPSTDIRDRDSSDVRRGGLPQPSSKDQNTTNFFGRPSRDYGSHKFEQPGADSEYTDSNSNTTSSGFRTSFGDGSASTANTASNASRSRTKSISSAAAAGVLKGLGLGSSSSGGAPPGMPMGIPAAYSNSGSNNSIGPPSGSGATGSVSAPSSVGKKSKFVKALRLGNSVSSGTTAPATNAGAVGPNRDSQANASLDDPRRTNPSSAYRGSGSTGLSHDESAATSPAYPHSISSGSHPHSAIHSHSHGHLPSQTSTHQTQSQGQGQQSHSHSHTTQQQQPQAKAGRTSVSAPQSPISYSPRSATSPPLPPLMSHSHSSAIRQSGDDGVMVSPSSASAGGGGGGGQRSSSSTTAHTSSSVGPGLKTLMLQPPRSGSIVGSPGAVGGGGSGVGGTMNVGGVAPVWRSGTGDGFGGGGGPLTSLANGDRSSVSTPGEDDWRKPMTLSPRTTSLGMGTGPGSGAGPFSPVGGGPSSSASAGSGFGRSRMPTSPTASRLGSIAASSTGSSASGTLAPSSGISASDSSQTITEFNQSFASTSSRGGLNAATKVGLERYASPPPVGGAGGGGMGGVAPSAAGALGLTAPSSAADQSEEQAQAASTGEGGQGPSLGNFPRPGQAEGVPYKLISLQEARANQAREREERNARAARAKGGPGPGPSSVAMTNGPPFSESSMASSNSNSNSIPSGMARSQSNPSGGGLPLSASQSHVGMGPQDDYGESHQHAGPHGAIAGGKVIKNKKSGGFLRMFNKDRSGDAPPVPGQRNGSVEEGRGVTSLGDEESRRSSARGSNGMVIPPPPKFMVSPDVSARGSNSSSGLGGGLGVGGGGGGGGLSVAVPALKLRPMSSMLSGFSADLLDPTLSEAGSSSASNSTRINVTTSSLGSAGAGSGAATMTMSPTASKSPTLLSPVEATHPNSRSTSMTSFTSGAASEDAKGSIVGGRMGKDPSNTLQASRQTSVSSAGGSGSVSPKQTLRVDRAGTSDAAMSRRTSDATNAFDSQAVQYANGGLAATASPTSSESGPTFPNPSGSLSNSSSSNSNNVVSGPQPAWKIRAQELEGKIMEYAAELAELRNTYFTAAAAAELAAAGGLGLIGEEDPEMGGAGSTTPSANPAGVSPVNGTPSREYTALPGTNDSSAPVIPACAMCGCLCAEQRRQQALNAAAILKGISVLDRGRAIKPGLVQSSRFGSYALRS